MLPSVHTYVYGRVTKRRSEVSRYSRGKIECKRWNNSENYSPYFCYISIARNKSRWEGTTRIMLEKKRKKNEDKSGKEKKRQKESKNKSIHPSLCATTLLGSPVHFRRTSYEQSRSRAIGLSALFRSTLAIPFPGDVRNSAWLRRLASQKDAYAYFLSPPSNESSTISRRSNHVYCILWKRPARWRLDVLAPFTYGAARNP